MTSEQRPEWWRRILSYEVRRKNVSDRGNEKCGHLEWEGAWGAPLRQLGQALTVQYQSHREANQGSLEDSPASFQCPFFLTPCSFSLLTKSILFLFLCSQPLSLSCSQSALTDWLTHLLSLRHQARPGATKVHRLWSEVIKLNRRVEIECDGRISLFPRDVYI